MNKNISILNIIEDTTVDGPGFRTSIYAAGCHHKCAGCHNPESWNIGNGTDYTINEILNKVKQAELSNVTFSGGDPFYQIDAFTELAKRIKAETNKTIWCYTGYLYEQVATSKRLSQILPFIDVLVDGQFVESLKDEDLQFIGSSNQRIIDVKESLKAGRAIKWSNIFSLSHVTFTEVI